MLHASQLYTSFSPKKTNKLMLHWEIDALSATLKERIFIEYIKENNF